MSNQYPSGLEINSTFSNKQIEQKTSEFVTEVSDNLHTIVLTVDRQYNLRQVVSQLDDTNNLSRSSTLTPTTEDLESSTCDTTLEILDPTTTWLESTVTSSGNDTSTALVSTQARRYITYTFKTYASSFEVVLHTQTYPSSLVGSSTNVEDVCLEVPDVTSNENSIGVSVSTTDYTYFYINFSDYNETENDVTLNFTSEYITKNMFIHTPSTVKSASVTQTHTDGTSRSFTTSTDSTIELSYDDGDVVTGDTFTAIITPIDSEFYKTTTLTTTYTGNYKNWTLTPTSITYYDYNVRFLYNISNPNNYSTSQSVSGIVYCITGVEITITNDTNGNNGTYTVPSGGKTFNLSSSAKVSVGDVTGNAHSNLYNRTAYSVSLTNIPTTTNSIGQYSSFSSFTIATISINNVCPACGDTGTTTSNSTCPVYAKNGIIST